MTQASFITLKNLNSSLTYLISTNDDKHDINDSNRIPYIAKFNRVIPNLLCVGDENGFLKFFKTYPKLNPIKEISAEKSCIYDIQWLNSNELACGGGDKFVSIFDVNTCTRTALLKGHTESVKSITQIDKNPFVIASGSRDGTILVYDLRCNKHDLNELTDSSNQTRTFSFIRPVNSIYNAHFVEKSHQFSGNSITNHQNARSLKSKSNNSNLISSPTTNCSKSYPVSCVLFQNEFYLVSSGATDGLIKMWDIRKIRIKKPISVFENSASHESNKTSHNHSVSKNIKGYSNLLFNNSRTLLYANCMNNYIYEYNFFTYNNIHTRIINKHEHREASEKKYTFNLNQSNFIKSSLSSCDNFILTGSSDFNAYIYPVKSNNIPYCLRNKIPVIVLKGHSNEVTTVDWNPFDSSQLVTCSDDNTIRIWNVEREFDIISSKQSECNFIKADTLFGDDECLEAEHESTETNIEIKSNHVIKYTSAFKLSNIYDDYIFKVYESKQKAINFNNKSDIEDELCLRYEKIDIRNEDVDSSKNCNNIFLNNNLLSEEIQEKPIFKKNLIFKDLLKPLSDLPINIIEASNDDFEKNDEINNTKDNHKVQNAKNLNGFIFRRQNSSSTLISVSSKTNEENLLRKKMKAKIINRRKNLNNYETPNRKEKPTQLESTSSASVVQPKISSSTSKKRNVLFCLNELDNNSSEQEIKTPRSKKRLLMTDHTDFLRNLGENNMLSSPKRTILHYFAQKENDK